MCHVFLSDTSLRDAFLRDIFYRDACQRDAFFTIFCATQRYNIVVTMFQMDAILFQHLNPLLS